MRAALLQQLLAGTRAIAAAAAAQLEAAQRGVREAPRLGDAGAAAALHVAQQMADIADTLQARLMGLSRAAAWSRAWPRACMFGLLKAEDGRLVSICHAVLPSPAKL